MPAIITTRGIHLAHAGGSRADNKLAFDSTVAASVASIAIADVICDLVNSPLFRVACVKKKSPPQSKTALESKAGG
jgi:hypothetical protein